MNPASDNGAKPCRNETMASGAKFWPKSCYRCGLGPCAAVPAAAPAPGGSAVLPPLPEWTKFDDLGGKVPSEIRTAFNNHAREAWTMGLDYGMQHAPAAVETELPDLARLLGAASKQGRAVKLSAIAAGTLYNAMTTAAAPAAPASKALQAGHVALDEALASGELRQLKAEAFALAADGGNWSMDVGCMFVLAMIERIEASAAPAPAAPNHASEMSMARRIGMLLANKTTISPVTAGKLAVDIIKMLPGADQQLAGYISPEDLPKLGQCRATLWAAPQADAVPVFLGAPAAAAGSARIAELEALVVKRDRLAFILGQTIQNIMVGNQSAWIEWQKGAGAEAAMAWIENGLIGPGLIPEHGAQSAQEWFDANVDDRMEPTDPRPAGSAT